MQRYCVIYDGNCNLCSLGMQLLEILDRGKLFDYIPMQDEEKLQEWGILSEDCNLGMILIDVNAANTSWQGSAAVEEIGRLLPLGDVFVAVYRVLPGVKWLGDRLYEFIRDYRYTLFGRRSTTYKSIYCPQGRCNF